MVKSRLNRLLIFLGGLFFLAGLGVLAANYVKAATGTYTETMTVTSWRNADSSWDPGNPLSIGPASWNVSGASGSTSFSETWTGGGWLDNAPLPWGGAYSYTNGPLFAETSPLQIGMVRSGLYGAISYDLPIWGQVGASIPTSWQISGTITTP